MTQREITPEEILKLEKMQEQEAKRATYNAKRRHAVSTILERHKEEYEALLKD